VYVNPGDKDRFMSAYDWSSFDIYLYIDGPAEPIFRKWVTAAGLESFFMKSVRYVTGEGIQRKSEELVKPGDHYVWEFYHKATVEGEVLAVEPNHKISFTFGLPTTVDVRLTESDGRTLVHLCQRNMQVSDEGMVQEHMNCRGAWIHFLTVLKSLVEFGIDCRDKQSLTAGSLTVGFIPEEYSQI
jgi:uncharacterized protein YndB with AHSA1/START domain